jgi:hypothetical protein
LYNLLVFNDGYHEAHHAHPSAHWTRLPTHHDPRARVSRWPAPIRWLEGDGLILLERLALRSPALQRFLLRAHEGAFRKLLTCAGGLERTAPRIAIVGGGLFPRTALVLRRLLPNTRLTIIDANLAHLNAAREWPISGDIEFVHERFPLSNITVDGETARPLVAYVQSSTSSVFDLIVFPLSFEGDRDALYDRPPARTVIVHDWLWRKRGVSAIVSVALLKRLNLVHG